jgi:hypothetical protein
MITKDKILDEIKRSAKENNGKPLGIARFEQETGIKAYYWKKYWARFGEAQKEAGFEPNQLQSGYTDEFVIKKVISVMRKLAKFPTFDELAVEKNNDSEFPSLGVFTKFGSKQNLVSKIIYYCKGKDGYEDIIKLCEGVSKKTSENDDSDNKNKEVVGTVYLFKHGKYYKIGKTNDTVRRGNELKIQLPENLDLIHEIKTDDPSGIEAYWHRRFDSKRMNGEWFDLSSSDIKAFKCWKRIC